jgi:hypothetical protein
MALRVAFFRAQSKPPLSQIGVIFLVAAKIDGGSRHKWGGNNSRNSEKELPLNIPYDDQQFTPTEAHGAHCLYGFELEAAHVTRVDKFDYDLGGQAGDHGNIQGS